MKGLFSAVMEQYAPLIRSIVYQVSKGHSSMEDDLLQIGGIGLWNAWRTYDQDKGVAFGSYASHKIKCAVLDELRKLDPLTREDRRAVKRAQANSEPLPEIATAAQSIDIDEVIEILGFEPSRESEEILRIIFTEVGKMGHRYQIIFYRHYSGDTYTAIADSLGISGQMVKYLNDQIIKQLQRAINGQEQPPLADNTKGSNPKYTDKLKVMRDAALVCLG